jgi:hypothetical protein
MKDLRYTTTPPTEPGWYWRRGWWYEADGHNRVLDTHVVEVKMSESQLPPRLVAVLVKRTCLGSIVEDVKDSHNTYQYEWAGPIKEPEGGMVRKKVQKRGKDF